MSIFKKENGALVEYTNPLPADYVAPIEDGATSAHDYAVGAFALVKGVLRKITTAVTSGTAITNANSEITTVAEQLEEINTDLSLDYSNSTMNNLNDFLQATLNRLFPNILYLYNNGSVGETFGGQLWTDTGSALKMNVSAGSPNGLCYAINQVDVTNYSSLEFKGTYKNTDGAATTYDYGISKTTGGAYTKKASVNHQDYVEHPVDVVIDISELTGLYYVKFSCTAGGTSQTSVSQIKLY